MNYGFHRSEQIHPSAAPSHTPAQSLADTMIDQIECGMLACDGQGRLLYANRAARRELAAERVLTLRNEYLKCVEETSFEFHAALRDAAERQRARLLQLGSDDRRLMVAVTPVAVGGVSSAFVMIGREIPGSPLAIQMLALRHGLTSTETRVLLALLANSSAREIAEAHGVGLATVRTQIQSVRNKFGARSIDALLLQVARLPPITARQ